MGYLTANISVHGGFQDSLRKKTELILSGQLVIPVH